MYSETIHADGRYPMKKRTCKLFLMLFIFTFTLLFSYDVNAADTLNPETVFDYADLLTTDEENRLRDYAKDFEQYEISIIFLTTNNAQGKSSMNYSNDFYDTNHFRPDGVLFMIDMDNRNIYIDTVGKYISMLENDIDYALDISYTYATDGEYYTCFQTMSEAICTEIENHENPILGAFRFSIFTFLLAAVIAIIIVIILIVIHNQANNKTAAERYIGSSFHVNDRNTIYKGTRKEVIPGYYKQNTNNGGGSGRHTSSRGVSHGGGGRRF